ncbi:MAG TPA: dienelactone hydrolase, partial [Afipia sp.]|nr:dienelactone hydrolase [Afipia sp.]
PPPPLPPAADPATELPPFFATPHSAAHLTDEARQPTNAAHDEIISFFARRLKS